MPIIDVEAEEVDEPPEPAGNQIDETDRDDIPPEGERKPKKPGIFAKLAKPRVEGGKRVSAEPMLGGSWQAIAMGLVITGKDIPVGRCMALQAPAAGLMLDKAIEGTLPDKVLVQPLARVGSKGTNIAALIGPPILVGMIERNPALYEPMKPLLRALMTQYLVETWPAVKAAQQKEKRALKTLEEMQQQGYPDVDTLVDSLFMPPGYPDIPEPEEATNADSNV